MSCGTNSDNSPVLIVGTHGFGASRLASIFESHPDAIVQRDSDLPPLNPAVPDICRCVDIDRCYDMVRNYLLCIISKASRAKAADGSIGDRRAGRGPVALKRLLGWVSQPPAAIQRPAPGSGRRVIISSSDLLGRLPVLTAAMPESRGILVIRNPFGHVAAMLRDLDHCGRKALSTACSLLATPQAKTYGLSVRSFGAMPLFEQHAWSWVLHNERAIEALSGLAASRVIMRRDVVLNPVRTAKSLFAFAGLSWNLPVFLENAENWQMGLEPFQGEDWPNPLPYAKGLADPFVQAFEDMMRPFYGSPHLFEGAGNHAGYGWEDELGPVERYRILTLVRSTSLSSRFPDLEAWANLN